VINNNNNKVGKEENKAEETFLSTIGLYKVMFLVQNASKTLY